MLTKSPQASERGGLRGGMVTKLGVSGCTVCYTRGGKLLMTRPDLLADRVPSCAIWP